MNWDTPSQTKWLVGAAVVVLMTGLAVMRKDGMPVLSASSVVNSVNIGFDSDLRDAVASPALPMAGAGGWFQAATGAAALSRAAHAPSFFSKLHADVPLRIVSGRKAFAAGRVIVDQVSPGVPEPVLSPKPQD
jgi:hypothetical protein